MRSYQRGFFCADLTIRYPYHECTITVPMLLVCMLLLPMLFLSVVEIMRLCHNFRMRQYLRNVTFSLGCFSFGFIATYLSTELAKNVVRRLRPHFYTACRPQLNDGSTCEDVKNRNLFVEQYYCSNRNLSALQLRELYVSFPSAHSSLSFYAMLFLAFYLHAIWRGGRGIQRVLRHLLQFLFLSMAWFISLSRVADYWHHWSDVLAGAVMGIIYATLTALYVGRFLQLYSHTNKISSSLPHGNCNFNLQHCTTAGGRGVVSNNLKSNLKKSSLQHVPSSVSFSQTLQQMQLQQTEDQTCNSTTALSSSSSSPLQASLVAAKEHLIRNESNECVWKSGT
ncbi:putative phosphatidate phosphatase [Lucilia cuprina]|uniref:Putative phosphatidate phosphatase n=1 Tax=Lucilia cuprina TaxID=7375 RepID=A0A0L0CRL3_LUCCU|nr:putative phosphatidate phosphatase [Lucilia cuprina]KNC34968.1 putative phosphatidate phosphatase [Lucilia cuprina]